MFGFLFPADLASLIPTTVGFRIEWSRYLGIDPITDGDLMWIADEVRCWKLLTYQTRDDQQNPRQRKNQVDLEFLGDSRILGVFGQMDMFFLQRRRFLMVFIWNFCCGELVTWFGICKFGHFFISRSAQYLLGLKLILSIMPTLKFLDIKSMILDPGPSLTSHGYFLGSLLKCFFSVEKTNFFPML